MTGQPRWRLADDLTAPVFGEGVALSLFDLYRTHIRMGRPMIERVTFRDCRIEGPAVLLPVGGNSFDRVNFGDSRGDIRNLVLRPEWATSVIGAIPVRDCVFEGAQFFGVGFTGPQTFLDQLLALGDKA